MPSTNDNETKVSTMLEKVVEIFLVEERLDSIRTVDCSIGNALCGIRKKLRTTLPYTSKSILIFMLSTNDNETKVLTMLGKVVQIVSVEERLNSIRTFDCTFGNALCGIR